MEDVGCLKSLHPKSPRIYVSGFNPRGSRLDNMEKLLGVTILGCYGILSPVAIKVSGSCISQVISLSKSVSEMSPVRTGRPCRFISTNPKAIYSKLYWIHFEVLLVQHKSMALGTMQSHSYRTALLGSQNCWWIVHLNCQEP